MTKNGKAGRGRGRFMRALTAGAHALHSDDAKERAASKTVPGDAGGSSADSSGDAGSDAAQAGRAAGPPSHDDTAVEVIAAKILIDWLRNRQQLLVPFKLDLQKLEAQQVDTLMHAMVSAAQADGAADGKERERLAGALQILNPTEEHRAALSGAIEHPRPLPEVLAQVPDVRAGALVYAASILAVDRRKLVNRQYLRYLAARLQLPRELVRTLEQRYGAAAA